MQNRLYAVISSNFVPNKPKDKLCASLPRAEVALCEDDSSDRILAAREAEDTSRGAGASAMHRAGELREKY